MAKEHITVPEIYQTLGFAHAVRVDNVLYTSGIVAKSKDGELVGKGDITAQAHQVYENLDAVLRSAGATWNDVAKYNAYLLHPEDRQKAREVHFQYLPLYQRAGATVVTPLADPDLLLEVDLVAYIGTPKHCITNVPNTFVPLGSPYAVKVDDTVYITGQQPVIGQQPLLKSGQIGTVAAHEQQVAGKGDIVAQTELVYRNFDAILKATGAEWSGVAMAHHYLTGNYIEQVRSVRYRYMTEGSVAMTSVVCGLVGPDWLIEGELVASLAPTQSFTVPGVAVSPGVGHAVKAGNTLYVQGQVARDANRNLVGKGDIVAQTEQVYRNLDSILRETGTAWSDVVSVKSYYKQREDFGPGRQVRSSYLQNGHFVSTAVVAGFFDPDFLLEVELIAVTE